MLHMNGCNKIDNMDHILIPVHEFCGHAYEYTINLYHEAIKRERSQFVFIVPPEFAEHSKGQFINSRNIKVEYLTVDNCDRLKKYNRLKKSWRMNVELRKWIKRYQINKVHLISYDAYYPYLPFMTISGVSYFGIYYYVYYYEYKITKWSKRLYYSVLMYLMCKNHSIKRLYFCNDYKAATYTNRHFRVTKCKELKDPFVPLQNMTNYDARVNYGISSNKKVFLHFGVLCKRKGSLMILDAIKKMKPEILERAYFIFAGKIQEDIRLDFYHSIEQIKSSNILLLDHFCSYDLLASLCRCSDYLLIPYLETSQSSGVLGYASQFNIPVIGPSNNLLGRLIRNYGLGYSFDTNNINEFIMVLADRCLSDERTQVSDRYLKCNNPAVFNQTIMNDIENDK